MLANYPITLVGSLLALCIFTYADFVLYRQVVYKHGPQGKTWPGDGLYLWLKYWWLARKAK